MNKNLHQQINPKIHHLLQTYFKDEFTCDLHYVISEFIYFDSLANMILSMGRDLITNKLRSYEF